LFFLREKRDSSLYLFVLSVLDLLIKCQLCNNVKHLNFSFYHRDFLRKKPDKWGPNTSTFVSFSTTRWNNLSEKNNVSIEIPNILFRLGYLIATYFDNVNFIMKFKYTGKIIKNIFYKHILKFINCLCFKFYVISVSFIISSKFIKFKSLWS
jgi:hypothetical protein